MKFRKETSMRLVCRLLTEIAVALVSVTISLYLLTSTLGNISALFSREAREAESSFAKVLKMEDISSATSDHADSDDTLSIDDSAARALRKKLRVLCWIPAREKDLQWTVKTVNETWAQRCDGHVFFVQILSKDEKEGESEVRGFLIEIEDKTNNLPETQWASAWPDVVALGEEYEGYSNLSKKVDAAMTFLYRHLNHYDWFLKADDNTYVIVENLRLLLSKYDPKQPVYLGQLYDAFPKGGPGFMGGGAGYVLSREALRLVVDEGILKGVCPLVEMHSEDRHVGQCLHTVGVERHYSRDIFNRESFHQFSPKQHIVEPGLAEEEFNKHFKFPQPIGAECCSHATVSFHYVDRDMMIVLDHLLYRTSIYGRQQNMEVLQSLFVPKTVPMP